MAKTIILTDEEITKWVIKFFNLDMTVTSDEELRAEAKKLNMFSISYNLPDAFPGLQNKGKLIEYVMEQREFKKYFYETSWAEEAPANLMDLDSQVEQIVELIISILNSKL